MASILRYTIVVTGSAYGTQSAFCAYQFCQALIEAKQKIEAIFFYQDGVYNANSFTSPANDEFNLVDAWQRFASLHKIPLTVCISAAQRRGVVSDLDNNLATGFELTGLGELTEKIATSDRVIQF
ncbi:sulfurtransferase complex subunit TusD [Orbaceae bacterium ac157xtp]